MTIKHLVLSGGGVKGISILGSLHYLFDKKIINIEQLQTIAGSSAGGLIGALISIGYTPSQLYNEYKKLTMSSILDPDISNFLEYYGLDSGYKLVSIIRQLFKGRGYNDNVTFIELYEKTHIHLILTGTNVNLRSTQYFDYIHTPLIKVVDAIRVSISFPLYFTAPKYKDCHYVDGGVLDNFPLHLFHSVKPHEILAIKLKKIRDSIATDKVQKPIEVLDNFEKYLMALIGCLLEEIEFLKSTTNQDIYLNSTIFIEQCVQGCVNDIGLMDLNISADNQNALYQMGIDEAKLYIRSDRYLGLKFNVLPDTIKRMILSYVNTHKT